MTTNPNRKSHFTYLLLVILITIVIIAIIIIMHTNQLVWHKDGVSILLNCCFFFFSRSQNKALLWSTLHLLDAAGAGAVSVCALLLFMVNSSRWHTNTHTHTTTVMMKNAIRRLSILFFSTLFFSLSTRYFHICLFVCLFESFDVLRWTPSNKRSTHDAIQS